MKSCTTIFALFLIFLFVVSAVAQTDAEFGDREMPEEFRSKFRYVVIRDASDIQKIVNEPDRKTLNLDVLLEDKAFTEANLRELFTLLRKRYAEKTLYVYVYTSLDAIRTPEEFDRIDLWGPRSDYKKFKRAHFQANGYGTWFTYSVPGKIFDKEVRMDR